MKEKTGSDLEQLSIAHITKHILLKKAIHIYSTNEGLSLAIHY